MTRAPSSGRRGQAAHEFLTMYGWTALLAVIALAVMFYFGAVNPDALKPTRCEFPPESSVECDHVSATTDGTLSLRLFNRGDALLVRGVECSYEAGSTVTTRTMLVDEKPVAEYVWGGAEFLPLACRFDGDNPFAGAAGTKRDVTVTLSLSDKNDQESAVTAPIRAPVEAAR